MNGFILKKISRMNNRLRILYFLNGKNNYCDMNNLFNEIKNIGKYLNW
jgi:hypothetical protein